MSGTTLFVGVVGMTCLHRVDLQETDAEGNPVARFKTWKDRDGIDLYWMGRRVDRVYTIGIDQSAKVLYRVPVPDAAESLLKRGLCAVVSSKPSPEGRLPA